MNSDSIRSKAVFTHPSQFADPALWQPLTGETVENHFSRCQRELKHAAKEMGY